MESPSRVELLSPAGDRPCLEAAVRWGADAVYFGVKRLNARLRAENFGVEELPGVMDYLRSRGVKGYLALNTLVFGSELGLAGDIVGAAAEAGINAVIVQDLGLLKLIRSQWPALPVHASTQMTQTQAAGVEVLGQLGVERVILARELPLAQIREIVAKTRTEVEVFVHGAICISYSGQCQASRVLMERSANRGACAQLCRIPWGMSEESEKVAVLSPKDQMLLPRVGELIAAGVKCLKIEGRLKGPEYVTLATRVYRQAINAALEGKKPACDAEDLEALELAFSRGFSGGYLDSSDPADLVDGTTSGKQGICVGTVVRHKGRKMVVAGPQGKPVPFAKGQGIGVGAAQKRFGSRIWAVRPAAGGTEIELAPDFAGRDALPGESAFVTDDPALKSRATQGVPWQRPARPLTLRVGLLASGGVEFAAQSEDVRATMELAAHSVEASKTHPLTAELVARSLGRLKETPFALAGVTLTQQGKPVDAIPVYLSASAMNQVRRRLVELLLQEIRPRYTKSQITLAEVGSAAARAETPIAKPQITALVRTIEQARAAVEGGANLLWLDFADWKLLPAAIGELGRGENRVGIALPGVVMEGEAWASKAMELGPQAILVRGMGAFGELAGRFAGEVWADLTLNACNSAAVALLLSLGASAVCPGWDVREGAVGELASAVPARSLELLVDGRVTLFHTQHQPGRDVESQKLWGQLPSTLSSPLAQGLPVIGDAGGRHSVLSPAVRRMGLLATGKALRAARAEFWDETPDEVRGRIAAIKQAMAKLPGC